MKSQSKTGLARLFPMSDRDVRLSRLRLACFASPSLPIAAFALPMAILLPPFYADQMGLGLVLVGQIIMLTRIWDVITDPVLGYVSDRFPTAIGRRRIWMLLGTPIMMASTVMLFIPDFLFGEVGSVYLAFWLFFVYIGWTMISLSHFAWGAEIHSSYDERSRIQGAVSMQTQIGLFLSLGIPIVLASTLEGVTALAALAGYLIIVLPLTTGLAVFTTPEKAASRTAGRHRFEFFSILKHFLRKDALRRLLVVYFIEGVATTVNSSIFLFFATYALGLQAELVLPLLLLYFVVGAIAAPVWVAISKRFNKHTALVLSYVYGSVSVTGLLLVPYGSFWAAVIGFAFLGFNIPAATLLIRSMMSDMSDLDELENEQQRAGLHFSFLNLVYKLGWAFAIGAVYPLLNAVGFDPRAEVPSESIAWVKGVFIGSPIVWNMLMIALMLRFPYDRQSHRATLEALESRRANSHSDS